MGGDRRKEDRSKFPSWISSVDQRIKFLLKKVFKKPLLFQVIAEGRNNYIKSDFLRVYKLFYPLCKIFTYFLGGFGGIFLCREGFLFLPCNN